MPKFNIVVFAGDYAGPEVTAEAIKVRQIPTRKSALVGCKSIHNYWNSVGVEWKTIATVPSGKRLHSFILGDEFVRHESSVADSYDTGHESD